jgi:serine/threonine protein kinase/WD40 repeat protein
VSKNLEREQPDDREEGELFALSARYQEALANHGPLPSLDHLSHAARRRFERLSGLIHALKQARDQNTSLLSQPASRERPCGTGLPTRPDGSGEPSHTPEQSTTFSVSPGIPLEDGPPPALVPGKPIGTLGHYQLLRERGRGGMGVVYEARDLVLDRLVAIKMIQPGRAGEDKWRSRFLAEGQMLGRLHHPHIVQVYEIGEQDGLSYLVLEHMAGPTLAAKLGDRPMEPHQAALLVETLARAVEHAHGNGILHRDLKPANVLLARDGTPKISDFGLAALLDQTSGLTQTGEVVGTPAYMAPEMTTGERPQPGRAVDVYGLGVILFEALTGRAPFVGLSPVLVLSLVRSVEPIAPRQLQPGVPRDLETICLKCLHKEPSRRYSSAAELAADLRRFVDGHPIQARPTSRLERTVRWARRRPGLALAWALALAGLLGVVGVSLGYAAVLKQERDNAREQEAAAELAQKTAEELERQADQARRLAEARLFDLITNFGLAAERESAPGIAALWFAQAARQAHANDPDGEAVSRLRWRAYQTASPVPLHAFRSPGNHTVTHLSLHPTGRQLITVSGGSWLLWDLSRQQPIPWPGPARKVTAAVWAPSGNYFATGSDKGDVHVWDTCQGSLVCQLQLPAAVTSLDFDAKSEQLALVAGQVQIWDLVKEKLLFPGPLPPEQVIQSAFSPKGRRLSTLSKDGTVWVYDLSDPQGPRELLGPLRVSSQGVGTQAPVFLGEDRLATPGREIVVWDLKDRSAEARIPGDGYGGTSAQSSLDGRSILVRHYDNPAELWQANPLLRLDLRLRVSHVRWSSISPEGTHILLASEQSVCLLDATCNPPRAVLLPHPFPITAAACTPTGRVLVTACQEGLIRVWRPGQLSPLLARLPTPLGNPSLFFQVSPDQKYVLTAQRRNDQYPLQLYSTDGMAEGSSFTFPGVPRAASFSPDGQTVYLANALGKEGELRAINLGTRSEFGPLAVPFVPLDVAFSPDGLFLVLVGDGGEVEVRQASDGQRVGGGKHPGHGPSDFPARRILFARDGKTFVTFGQGGVAMRWDTTAGRCEQTFPHQSLCLNADLSPDGRLVATCDGNGEVCLWDLSREGVLLSKTRHPEGVFTVRFDPSGDRVATGCHDGSVRIWDWRAGQQVVPALANGREVLDLAFSSDGRWIFTADPECARVWEARSGMPLTPPWPLLNSGQKPGYFASRLALAGEGRRLLVGSRSGYLCLFDLGWLLDAPAADLSADELVQLAEINAGVQAMSSGSMEQLSAEQWWQRWQTFPQKHPARKDE